MPDLSEIQKLITLRGVKSAISGLTASLEEAMLAYATDTNQLGIYTNGAWVWFGGTVPTVATDTIWDAKGDLAAGTGADTAARLAVGTNTQVVVADSTQSTGLRWANPPPGELLMMDGTTSPPVPLENEAGDDWIYADAF